MPNARILRRRTPLLLLTTALALSVAVVLPAADADPTDDRFAADPIVTEPLESKLALLEVADHETLHNLETYHHIDVAHWHEPTEDGRVRTAAFVTDDDLAYLAELGVDVLDVDELPTFDDIEAQMTGSISRAELDQALERQDEAAREAQLRATALGEANGSTSTRSAVDQAPAPVDETDQLRVLRADVFTNYAGDFLSFEVRSLFDDTAANNNGRDDRVEIEYRDGPEQRIRTLTPFNDAGQYIYHRLSRPVWVIGRPDEVTVRIFERLRDEDGDLTGDEELLEELTVDTAPWASNERFGYPDGFQRGFVGGYLDSVDSHEMMFELAEQFPDLAEVVELPNQTNGYQRKGMATYGGFQNTAVVLNSHAWGHEGGNDITFEVVGDDDADEPIAIEVDGSAITVTVATEEVDGDEVATVTAAEVIDALNADDDASELVHASTYRGNAGAGTIELAGVAELSDFLNAPEDKIERGPKTNYALRIGKHRDGSKTGVFAYSQEHAREWVTPVVAIETASRLLHNYGSDPDTTAYVDDLDIFIVPTVNPDGTDYSMYDNQTQRRNMTNHCDEGFNDSGLRHAWGVDLNRNFRHMNLDQGYSGASTSCTSDVFAGPSPLSEPEAQNTAWIVDENPNIRFSMNVHTHGGYFMWAPGSYMNPGRVPAPRPELGIEDFFFDASETILSKIAEHRGTVIEPGRTGPIIDVLYSAAGNSADDFWYGGLEEGNPIFGWSFEAGANRYEDGRWQGVGGFFPDYVEEGFNQAMEFSNGIYGMLEVAHQFEHDDQAPTTEANVAGDVNYDGPVDVFFTADEAATIHYTLDGTEPTLESDTVGRWGGDDLLSGGARDSADPVHIDETTTLRWFGVDAAGNEEEPNEVRVHIDEDPPFVPEPGETCETITGGSFPDVIDGDHAANIECVAGFGIAQGSTDGTYRPGDDVRRDQMTSFLARMLAVAGVDLPETPGDAFPDDQGGTHELATNQLAQLGIVQGRVGGDFHPSDPVTRAQMASFLVRSLEAILERDLSATSSPFTDTAGSPHAGNIDVVADLGVTLGRTPTTFQPNNDVRRDQMASFLARTLGVLVDEEVTLTPLS